jgi:hypothetical protein
MCFPVRFDLGLGGVITVYRLRPLDRYLAAKS